MNKLVKIHNNVVQVHGTSLICGCQQVLMEERVIAALHPSDSEEIP